MDLDAIVAAILGFADPEKLRNALKEKAKLIIFQPFFNEGHAVATGEATQKETKLKADLDAAVAAQQKAEKDLNDWKASNKDTAKIHEQYTAQIEDLKQKHKTELEQRDAKDQEKEVSRGLKTLEASLVARGVDPTYAKALVKDEAIAKRIQPNNGSVRVLQKDKDIAFAESDPDKAIGLLADEMVQGVDSKFITSQVKRGSGRSTTTGDAREPRGDKTEQAFEHHKEAVAKKFGRATDSDDSDTAPRHRRNRNDGDRKDALNRRLGLSSR